MTSTRRSPTSPASRVPTSRRRPKRCPVLEDGQLVAVDLDHHGERRRVEPSYVVVADGSMNRFGRELGIGAA